MCQQMLHYREKKKWLNEKVLSAKTTKSEEMFLDVSISVNSRAQITQN